MYGEPYVLLQIQLECSKWSKKSSYHPIQYALLYVGPEVSEELTLDDSIKQFSTQLHPIYL